MRTKKTISTMLLSISILPLVAEAFTQIPGYNPSCVEYIKANYPDYKDITGNAYTWWSNTKLKQLSSPEIGSVLVFPSGVVSGYGHVAYVTDVRVDGDSNVIKVVHANWNAKNALADNTIWKEVLIKTTDNWKNVRVEFGKTGTYGSTSYKISGFVKPNSSKSTTPPNGLKDISLDVKITIHCDNPLSVGDSTLCSANVTGGNGTSVNWSIKDPQKASINKDSGRLKALSVGKTKVKATYDGVELFEFEYPIEVLAAKQTINNFNPPYTAKKGSSLTLSANATSGLPVTFKSNTLNVCTTSGSTLSLKTTGTCQVQAEQAGNANYNSASPVPRNISVSK